VPHHYPKSTIQAAAYCPTCDKETPHYVYDGRLGRCMNEHPHPEPVKQENAQGDLFA
jgi:hypothetical protein